MLFLLQEILDMFLDQENQQEQRYLSLLILVILLMHLHLLTFKAGVVATTTPFGGQSYSFAIPSDITVPVGQ